MPSFRANAARFGVPLIPLPISVVSGQWQCVGQMCKHSSNGGPCRHSKGMMACAYLARLHHAALAASGVVCLKPGMKASLMKAAGALRMVPAWNV